jgi:hypothetical protein
MTGVSAVDSDAGGAQPKLKRIATRKKRVIDFMIPSIEMAD